MIFPVAERDVLVDVMVRLMIILSWKLSWKGVFDVCSYYNSLFGPVNVSFPWKSILCVAPKSVFFFVDNRLG